jgi:hypothetical protein
MPTPDFTPEKFNSRFVATNFKLSQNNDLQQAELIHYARSRLGPLSGPLFCNLDCNAVACKVRAPRCLITCPTVLGR